MNSDNVIISVIIPIYNAERFLSQCLDSILAQTFKNWELIAVDDGSTDNSLKILMAYAVKDSRIKIISKSNEGVSIARNTAINKSCGEYVYFVDADDIIEPECLFKLIDVMKKRKASLVKADYYAIDEKGNVAFINKKQFIRKKFNNEVLNADIFGRKVLLDDFFLWTCLFQRNIIEKNTIRFIPHCRLMEDAAFLATYLVHSPRNIYVYESIYGYRKYGSTASAALRDYSNDLQTIMWYLKALPNIGFVNHIYDTVRRSLTLYNGTKFQKVIIRFRYKFNKIIIYIKYFLSR